MASILAGIPGHPIEDVKISDVMIVHQGGGTKEDAARQIAEKEKEYPEPKMFGATPAHGFFIRHARGCGNERGSRLNMRARILGRRLCSRMWTAADFGRIKVAVTRACRRFR